MKKVFLFSIIILCGIVKISAQDAAADAVIGYYFCVDPFTGEESQNYIYKAADGTYQGKVVWVKNPKLEHHVGLIFLKNLKYNEEDNEWQNGTLIYPGKKGSYKTYMSLSGNTLKVRGYWGFALLGKTVYWTKESKQR